MAAYMRYNFNFLGIKAPLRREISKDFIKNQKKIKIIDWNLLENLMNDEYREINYLAIDLLKSQEKLLALDDYDKLINLSKIRPWWDTIDNLDTIIGNISESSILQTKMLELSKSQNYWLRRIAIGHQRKHKYRTNTKLLGEIITNNLRDDYKDKDEEFFINKAIGWALREYSKTNPAWVKEFIEKYENRLSNLSKREASKYI